MNFLKCIICFFNLCLLVSIISSKTDQDILVCSHIKNKYSHSSCEKELQQPAVSMTTSLALVPFDESRVLPHEKTVREFKLAGHLFTIKQDWNTLGVAAVVWDSVSHMELWES